MSVDWHAGFAARSITPEVGTPLSGFVIRQRGSIGVHDPLFARALVLDDGDTRCCLLFLDLIGVDVETTHAIRREIGRTLAPRVSHVAVVATHTHGGPPILTDAQLGPVDPGYRALVIDQAAAAAAEAIGALRATTVRLAVGREATIAHNRRDPSGPIDPDVPVLRLDQDDRPAALIVGYACHPVTLGPDNLHVTRDYPGELLDDLERRYPGIFVAFAPGCSGQINTGHRAEDSMRSGRARRRSFAEARRIGRKLSLAAARAAEDAGSRPPLRGPLDVATAAVHLQLAPTPDDAGAPAAWREELARVAGSDPARAAVLRATIAWHASLAGRDRRSVEVEATCIGLGDACVAFYPGEVFVEFGLELKAAYPHGRIMTIAHANAAPGYLPHRSAYAAGGYEVAEAHRYYGQPGPFPPEAGARLQDTMLGLARDVLQRPSRDT